MSAGRSRRCGAPATCTTWARGRVRRRVGEGRAADATASGRRCGKHAGYTERILARPPLLARLGALGSLDHERMDGTGYPRRAARIAAAGRAPAGGRRHVPGDARDAPAPAADPREEVAAVLDGEASKGRLDRDAVRAVLETADDRVGAAGRAARPRRLPGRPVRRGDRRAPVGVRAVCRTSRSPPRWRSPRGRGAVTCRTRTRRSASRRAPPRRCSR